MTGQLARTVLKMSMRLAGVSGRSFFLGGDKVEICDSFDGPCRPCFVLVRSSFESVLRGGIRLSDK
jgi:hypothetical protein